MAHQSPTGEEHSNDRSNNSLDQQYKNWDIVKATQVVSFNLSVKTNFVYFFKIQYGVFDRCKEIIDAGYDVNQRDEENVSRNKPWLYHTIGYISFISYFLSR